MNRIHIKKTATFLISPDIAVSSFLAFTFFGYGWIMMYLTNYAALDFSLKNIIPTGLLLFLAFDLILAALIHISKRIFRKIIIGIFFAFGLGLYVQGTFLDNDFGLLDGHSIDWSSYSKSGQISLWVWLICFLIAALIGFLVPSGVDIMKRASFVLLCVEIISIGAQFAISGNAFWKSEEKKTTPHLQITSSGEFDLSYEDNTIILIVDTLDFDYVREVFNDDKYKNIFNDFTLFSNVVSEYTFTQMAVPCIVTGNRYTLDKPYKEYLDDAYTHSVILDALSENGYNIGVYTENSYVGASEQIGNQRMATMKLQHPVQFTVLMSRLVSFRYMPQFLKQFFHVDTNSFSDSVAVDNAYYISNFFFQKQLKDKGITAEYANPCFRVYHIVGAHDPYNMAEDSSPCEESTPIAQTKGVFNIIDELLNQMRDKQVYEKANIIILADHGKNGIRQHPAILIKRSGESHPLVWNDYPFSYHENLTPTILSMIHSSGEKDLKESAADSKTFFSINEQSTIRTVFSPISREYIKSGYYYPLYGYSSSGHAGAANEFYMNGDIYSPNPYSTGYPVEYGLAITAADFISKPLWGWGTEGWDNSRYCVGTIVPFTLRMEDVPDDLVLSIDVGMGLLFPGEFELYMGTHSLGIARLNSDQGTLQFVIPKELIREDGMMPFTLRPVLEEGVSPKEIEHLSTIRCNSITIEKKTSDPIICDSYEWHLVPRELKNAEIIQEDSVAIHPGGARGGYFLILPPGDYELVVLGEKMDGIQCSIPDAFTSKELQRTDSEIVIGFSADTLTKSCNFIVLNYGTDDALVEDVILRQVK